MKNSTDYLAKSFSRAVKLMAANPENPFAAHELAERNFGADSREAAIIQKAAVGAALTTSANWAASLASPSGLAFVGSALEGSVAEKLTQSPPNVNVSGVTTGATAGFLAEGAPAPMSSMVLSSAALEPKVVVAALAFSKELAKFSDARAEAIFERELRKATIDAVDGALLSTNAASATKAAGLLNGVTAVTATSDPTADIRDLVDDFAGDLTSAFFVASPKIMGSIYGADRPMLGLRNGELMNAPALVSRNAPAGTLILIDGDGVLAAISDVDVSVSEQASAIMADNPSGASAVVNFWQSGLVGIRLTLNIDWAKVRPGSVSFISGAAW